MITEDELAKALIKSYREYPNDEFTFGTEVHYNHYGDRGIADLFVQTKDNKETDVYELKSEYAVKQAGGANEIIRQFNRMREYFFKGTNNRPPASGLVFELTFTPTEYNYRHLVENYEMYSSLGDTSTAYSTTDSVTARIMMRSPEWGFQDPMPLLIGDYDFYQLGENYPRVVESGFPEVYEEIGHVIEELAPADP